MSERDDDNAENILHRIEELEIMLDALRQAREVLKLFLNLPSQPKRDAG